MWRRLLVWSLIGLVWLAVALAGLLAYVAYDLPDVTQIAADKRRPSVQILTVDGGTLAGFGDLYGEALAVETLPAHLSRAVLAVEDRRFYAHPGVDPIGLGRALIANLWAGRIVQGGSTITQQLAKNLFLTPARTLERKLQEMLLALQLERRFSKDEILSLYLNRVYLGAGTYGVDAAARRYFGKSAREVGLYESALLAGMLKAPSRYNPARDPEQADARARVVLDAMAAAGFIAPDVAEAAKRYPPSRRRLATGRGRYFADWILGRIEEQLGGIDRDLIVRTTLDPKLQTIAEEEVAGLLDGPGRERDVEQAAVVLLAPDGAVRAMVGGRSYADSQFNRAVQALRQPGSAFKLFVFLAALEQGLTPDSRVTDAPVRVATASGSWSPENYASRYYGEVTLREAFARSLNSVAVRLTQRVGPEAVAEAARRLGITSDLSPNPSLALGTEEVSLLELTGAYAVLANRGRGLWPYGIEEIRDREGRVLFRRQGSGPGALLRPAVQRGLVELLHATVAWGTGKAADPGRPAAAKTGTSQGSRDAWFVGYTADLVGGVWLGNDDGRPMRNVTGGSLPAALWKRLMERGLEGVPARPLPSLPASEGGVPVAASEASGRESGRNSPPGQAVGGFFERLFDKLGVSRDGDDAARPALQPRMRGVDDR